MTRRSEESVATKRDCGKGTAPHNIWPMGAIRKHLLFSFLGGNTTSLREDWWHSRLKVGDLSLPFKLGTSLTSISHPKLMLRDSKAKNNSFYNSFLENSCRLWAKNWLFILSAWSRVRKPDSASRVPRIHSLHFFFLNSTADWGAW